MSASFTDAGEDDGHVATLDWGDGTLPEEFSWDPTGGAATLEATHSYTYGGIYTVTLEVRDDNGATATSATTAVISGVGLNDGTLYVIGTEQNDSVTVNMPGGDRLRVYTDFLPQEYREYAIYNVSQIIAYLFEGDDRLAIAGAVNVPAIVHGGAGTDHLQGGGGAVVLLGDSGSDRLLGGNGRSILIGGAGADFLVGGSGEDLLIGGGVNFADSDQALLNLLHEWDSASDYWIRIDHLRHGIGTSGLQLKQGTTVSDDGERDALIGGAGLDWFFTDDLDMILDKKTSERKDCRADRSSRTR